MKVLKRAEQKNAFLDTEMYTQNEIENLAYQGYIFKIYDNDFWRVSLTSCEEIKVEYNKQYEFYTTVAIHIDGTKLFIKL